MSIVLHEATFILFMFIFYSSVWPTVKFRVQKTDWRQYKLAQNNRINSSLSHIKFNQLSFNSTLLVAWWHCLFGQTAHDWLGIVRILRFDLVIDVSDDVLWSKPIFLWKVQIPRETRAPSDKNKPHRINKYPASTTHGMLMWMCMICQRVSSF